MHFLNNMITLKLSTEELMLLNRGAGEDSFFFFFPTNALYLFIFRFYFKGDQSWVFIGRSDSEAETPIFWPPDVKS